MEPQWLTWAKRLQALAQNGLTFARDPFDIERYQAIRALAAEMLAAGAGLDFARTLELFSAEQGYATPKIDVRGAVFRDNSILLVKERADRRWTLPGGWADVCESPAENVVREIVEESGYRTQVVKLAAVYDRSKHPHDPPHPQHVYKLFFICRLIDGSAKTSSETEDIGFFREDALPSLSVARITAAQVARMFAHYRDPALPTDFD